jgi:hypothetical protein
MSDADTIAMRDQQQVLREIRDELRGQRAGGVGGYASNASPGGAYMAAQARYDQMAAGQWATLGWADPYRSHIQSSFMGNVFGAIGFSRAPNTMTQLEFEEMSGELLGSRLGGIPGYLLAPRFSGLASGIGENIYSHSPRFARFGDAMSGAMGSGVNLGAANQIGRNLAVAAAGDLRLSGTDYRTIMASGLSSGQFDQVQSLGALEGEFKRLAQTVGDLTRITRSTVTEMSGFIGQLRQAGVGDIGDQRRIIEGLSATSRVAGVAFGEMVPGAGAAMSAGLGMGISSATSAAAYGLNFATARNMSRGGAVSPTLMAMAGGANGFAAAMTAAQQATLSSTGGALAYLGGASSRGFLGGMLGGLSAFGGSVDGVMGFMMDQADLTAGADAGALYDSKILSMSKLLGGGSNSMQHAAYADAMANGMSPAQAAMAARRYSAAGYAARASSAVGVAGARRSAAAGLDYDQYFLNETFGGTVQRGMAATHEFFAGIPAGLQDFFSPGQTGSFGLAGSYGSQSAAIMHGTATDRLSMKQMMAALDSTGAAPTMSMRLAGASTGRTLLAGGLTGFGVGVGGYYGALAGSMILPGVGTVVGGVMGSIAGSLAGGLLGYGAAGEMSRIYGVGASAEISATQAANISAMGEAFSKQATGMDRERVMQVAAKSATFINTVRDFRAQGQLNAEQTLDLEARFSRVARETGMSISDVSAAANAAGIGVTTKGAYGVAGDDAEATLKPLLSGVSTGANFATSEGSASLAAYLKAIQSGSGSAEMDAGGKLMVSAGATSSDLKLIAKAARSSSSIGAMIAAAEGRAQTGISRYGANIRRDFASAIRAEISGLSGNGAALEELDKMESSNYSGVFSSALSEGSAIGTALKSSNGPLANVLRRLSSRDSIGMAEAAKSLGVDYQQLAQATGGDVGKQAEMLALAAVTAQSSSPEGNQNRAAREAANLNHQTSVLLKGLADRLGINAGSGGKGK